MKKLIFLIIPLLVLSSCQIAEEVYFNKNGSGTYNFKVDMSGITQMFNGMTGNDSIQKNKVVKKNDTIILFGDMMKRNKDSIRNLPEEEQELLKSLQDAKIHMHVDESKDEMYFSYEIPFKNVTDLSGIYKKLNKLNSYNKKGVKEMKNDMTPGYQVLYQFNKHGFHRMVRKTEGAVKRPAGGDEKMLKMIQYEIVYHFPYKIDEVTYKDALIAADGKSVHIKVPLDSLMKNPEMLDFKVKFR